MVPHRYVIRTLRVLFISFYVVLYICAAEAPKLSNLRSSILPPLHHHNDSHYGYGLTTIPFSVGRRPVLICSVDRHVIACTSDVTECLCIFILRDLCMVIISGLCGIREGTLARLVEVSNIFISLIRKPEKKDSSGALVGGVGIKTDVARIWWCVF
jgi:hypothetical protein